MTETKTIKKKNLQAIAKFKIRKFWNQYFKKPNVLVIESNPMNASLLDYWKSFKKMFDKRKPNFFLYTEIENYANIKGYKGYFFGRTDDIKNIIAVAKNLEINFIVFRKNFPFKEKLYLNVAPNNIEIVESV